MRTPRCPEAGQVGTVTASLPSPLLSRALTDHHGTGTPGRRSGVGLHLRRGMPVTSGQQSAVANQARAVVQAGRTQSIPTHVLKLPAGVPVRISTSEAASGKVGPEGMPGADAVPQHTAVLGPSGVPRGTASAGRPTRGGWPLEPTHRTLVTPLAGALRSPNEACGPRSPQSRLLAKPPPPPGRMVSEALRGCRSSSPGVRS